LCFDGFSGISVSAAPAAVSAASIAATTAVTAPATAATTVASTASATIAPGTAAIAASAATAAVAAPATTATAFLTGAGLIHGQRTAIEVVAIEFLNGAVGLIVVRHHHEAETSGTAGFPIGDDLGLFHRAKRLKKPA
jgi:hypothetical protein